MSLTIWGPHTSPNPLYAARCNSASTSQSRPSTGGPCPAGMGCDRCCRTGRGTNNSSLHRSGPRPSVLVRADAALRLHSRARGLPRHRRIALSLRRCSRGGRTARPTFSGNGPSTALASGTWRMSFGWVTPPSLLSLGALLWLAVHLSPASAHPGRSAPPRLLKS